MSDGNVMGADRSQPTSSHGSGTTGAAKEAAADLKNTATDAAEGVAGTAKDEAAAVARETKAQAADLFHQTQQELSAQAATQQERMAASLGAIGDELGSMARHSEGSSIAADLVQRASDKASSAAAWLNARGPSDVLEDVKTFARRRPMAFIGAALAAGVVAGRLTRALASGSDGDSSPATMAANRGNALPAAAGTSRTATPPMATGMPGAGAPTTGAPMTDAPMATQPPTAAEPGYPPVAETPGATRREGTHGRSDSF